MSWRLLGIAALLVVTGCATNTRVVRAPESAPAPVVSAPEPVVVVPTPEPVPTVRTPIPELPPVQNVPDKPVPATPVSGLLASVQAAVAAGKLDQGAALSERALRISPRDAQLWYQLALIRYRQQRAEEAAGAAKRALSLAGKDTALLQQINGLLQELANGLVAPAR